MCMWLNIWLSEMALYIHIPVQWRRMALYIHVQCRWMALHIHLYMYNVHLKVNGFIYTYTCTSLWCIKISAFNYIQSYCQKLLGCTIQSKIVVVLILLLNLMMITLKGRLKVTYGRVWQTTWSTFKINILSINTFW